MEYKGIEYLRRKLDEKRKRVIRRYKYYEQKNTDIKWSPIMPPEMKAAYESCLGWCSKSVDSLADRLVFKGFEDDLFGINDILDMNNRDVLLSSAILSALISSCSFVYISDDNGFPRLQVIDGGNATGIIDPITNMLNEGYAVLERTKGDRGTPTIEAYFTKEETVILYRTTGVTETYPNPAAYPLLVPIINRPDAARPFGHSRISRACMSIQDKARETITRADVTAEFYSFPQKYILGTSQDADPLESWKATVSSFIEWTKDEDGDRPTVGQFAQQSMEPHLAQVRMYASLFSGETGLTLDDLGFPSENPSSAEAIKATHESLRLAARKAQADFGVGFLNVGFLAASLRDNYEYQRNALYMTKPVWYPVFETDSSMLSSIGDGMVKVNQAIPGFFNTDNFENLTGISASGMTNE